MASLYNTSPVMSPTDTMSSLSNLEKFMESASACTTPYNRSSTSSPTHFPQQQSASSCSNWQAGLVQQQPDCVSMMSGSESAMYCNKQQQVGGGGGSMQGYLGSAPELLGSTMMSNDWQHLLDTNTRFGSMRVVPLVSMQVQAATAGIMEDARIRELISRAGSLSAFQWGAMDATGITVDPSKGGFALQGGTVRVASGSINAASSHCLAQFTSDPAFAERAAKYSSFGAGKCSQIALPVTVENSSKPRGGLRSVEIGSSGKISRTSSLNLKKQQHGLAAVATSLEDNIGLEVGNVAMGELELDRNDEHEEALADDKSLPVAAAAAAAIMVQQQQQQQELEAVEGATEAMSMGNHRQMMMSHVEVEVAAAVAQDNSSCSEQQQQVGGRPGGSSGSPDGGAEPASPSPARSDDSGSAKKRKNSAPAAAGDIKADISYRDSKGDADIVDDVKPKRCKGGEEEGRVDRDQSVKLLKGERSCSDNSAESGSPRDHHKENHHHKLRDHSKQDYIHVRARRGQATDSHSLAERVRREKISERMKYLQDLVPGCSKVTGKAVMLDEIINYVQSLQRQVEHLSMKLASVNPGRPEFNLENLMSSKEVSQSARMSSVLGGPDMNATLGTLFQQQQQSGIMLGAGPCGIDFRSMGTGMDTHLRRSFSNPISSALSGMTAVDAFDDNVSQSVGWDGELQSIVNHMGLSHPGRFGSLRGSLHCPLRVGHMKAEF